MDPIRLDFTSDSCAVMADVPEEAVDTLGGYLCGDTLDDLGNGWSYAAIGYSWADCEDLGMTDREIDAYHDRVRAQVIAEIEAAGLDWEEVA